MNLLVIGFDGLDYRFVKQHNLFNDFLVYRMFSPVARTGAAWTSIYTGLAAWKHGVIIEGDPEHREKLASSPLNDRCIWRVLNRHGISTGLMNLPLTQDSFPVDPGFIIGGFPYQSKPEYDMVNWFDRKEGEILAWGKARQSLTDEGNLEMILKQSKRDAAIMIRDFIELNKMNVDFGFIQFPLVDRVGHLLGALKPDQVRMLYNAVGRIASQCIRRLNPRATVVVSDHGFSLKGGTHYPNDKEAVFATTVSRPGMPSVTDVTGVYAFIMAYFRVDDDRPTPDSRRARSVYRAFQGFAVRG